MWISPVKHNSIYFGDAFDTTDPRQWLPPKPAIGLGGIYLKFQVR